MQETASQALDTYASYYDRRGEIFDSIGRDGGLQRSIMRSYWSDFTRPANRLYRYVSSRAALALRAQSWAGTFNSTPENLYFNPAFRLVALDPGKKMAVAALAAASVMFLGGLMG